MSTASSSSTPQKAGWRQRGCCTTWRPAASCREGLIFNRVNPILAQGAAFGGVALVDRFAGDVTQIFRAGDELRVDPSAGLVEILNRGA
jgi:hypothetical protein